MKRLTDLGLILTFGSVLYGQKVLSMMCFAAKSMQIFSVFCGLVVCFFFMFGSYYIVRGGNVIVLPLALLINISWWNLFYWRRVA